jgi:glycosyltransferase involved in cell wall biosynthesis
VAAETVSRRNGEELNMDTSFDSSQRWQGSEARPKCTVAIPAYNRKDMIAGTLKSVLSQQLSDLEVLVVDDCSTDGCWEVLKTFHDSRLRLVRNEVNVGLFGNFNRCLELARGSYVRILCNDDQLTEGCLARECALMDANPSVAILSSASTLINGERRRIGVSGNCFKEGIYPGRLAIAGALFHMAHLVNPLSCPSGVLLRLSVVRKVGWFETSMRMCGDIDFFLRMMEHGDLAVLRAEGAVVKLHPGTVTCQLRCSDAALVETISITQRYTKLLKKTGLFEEVQRRMASGFTGHAFVLLTRGQFELSKKFFRAAAHPFTEWPHLAVGIPRFFALKFLRRVLGVHMLPLAVRRARRSPLSVADE